MSAAHDHKILRHASPKDTLSCYQCKPLKMISDIFFRSLFAHELCPLLELFPLWHDGDMRGCNRRTFMPWLIPIIKYPPFPLVIVRLSRPIHSREIFKCSSSISEGVSVPVYHRRLYCRNVGVIVVAAAFLELYDARKWMPVTEAAVQVGLQLSWRCIGWPFEEALFSAKVECLCAFVLVSTGLPGEECEPGESRGGQAEGQIPRPGPEARRLRLPDEETTERGRWLRSVHDMVRNENSEETRFCQQTPKSRITCCI